MSLQMLETERLIPRTWQLSDLPAFHAICSDAEVMRFVGDGRAWSEEASRQFISRNIETAARFGYCQWALIHREDSTLIGYCGFVPAREGAEIGWRLAPAYWGRGLATEAARAALRHGFGDLGFPRIIATVQDSNQASIRVVEKLGMRPEDSFLRHGRRVLAFAVERARD